MGARPLASLYLLALLLALILSYRAGYRAGQEDAACDLTSAQESP